MDVRGVGDADKGGGDHVAVLERGGEVCTLVRVVAEPVEELGAAPLVGVDAAAPLDGFKTLGVGECGDLDWASAWARWSHQSIVVVERLECGVDGDDGRAGGVEGDRLDACRRRFRSGEDFAGGLARASIWSVWDCVA